MCSEFSTSMECLNEPRVYLKFINEMARASLFMTLSGCAGGRVWAAVTYWVAWLIRLRNYQNTHRKCGEITQHFWLNYDRWTGSRWNAFITDYTWFWQRNPWSTFKSLWCSGTYICVWKRATPAAGYDHAYGWKRLINMAVLIIGSVNCLVIFFGNVLI